MPAQLEATLFLPQAPWLAHTSEARGEPPSWFRSHVANATPVILARLLPYLNPGLGNAPAFADALAARYEAIYSNHVSAAFGAPALQRYIYFHGGRIKVNAHNGTDFVVVAFEAGIWDISSGYKPIASGGAATKWGGPDRALRFWTY
jgi:hypothetical protein